MPHATYGLLGKMKPHKTEVNPYFDLRQNCDATTVTRYLLGDDRITYQMLSSDSA